MTAEGSGPTTAAVPQPEGSHNRRGPTTGGSLKNDEQEVNV